MRPSRRIQALNTWKNKDASSNKSAEVACGSELENGRRMQAAVDTSKFKVHVSRFQDDTGWSVVCTRKSYVNHH